MGVVTARLLFLAFVGLTGAIIYNALYLQGTHGLASVAPHKVKAETIAATDTETTLPPPVSTDLPPLEVQDGPPKLLVRAVQRELAARGFDVGAENGELSAKTRAAIAAYQQKHELDVTGLATDELLRNILLGESVKSAGTTGSVDDSAREDDATVRAVQQLLADLGYAPGKIDGALGSATMQAVSAFQRDRKITVTGHITPELLSELKRVTGKDLTRTAATR
jgi:peptidoglycan hydrolase-like protein with peptidoglycan-binding domain